MKVFKSDVFNKLVTIYAHQLRIIKMSYAQDS